MFRLAHLLLLLLLTYQLVMQAADAPSNSSHAEAPTNCVVQWLFKTDLIQYHLGLFFDDDNMCLGRHTSEQPREGAFKGTSRKLELMFWTIMAPEILPALALASLNAITFILWWNKPLPAQAIVRVLMERNLTDAESGELVSALFSVA